MRVLSILLLLVTTLLSSSPSPQSAQPQTLLPQAAVPNAQSGMLAPAAWLAQPFTGDPIAPRPAPLTPAPYTAYFTETGHYLGGEFLDYYNASPQAATLYGLPISEEFPQQFNNGTILYVQYFERARMEWHPELPAGQRVQLGALSAAILGNKTFDMHAPVDNTNTSVYFLKTGHMLSNAFLTYWQANGGLAQFGYPLSEETSEDGVTVQWFERASFEYYGDMPAPYGVQLSPVGYLALKAANFNLPMGALVRFNPPRVAEGHTTTVMVGASAGVSVTGEYEGNQLTFQLDPERGVAWAVLGAQPFQDVGTHPVTINLQNGDGGKRTVTRNLETIAYPFPSESLQFDPETAALLAPDVVAQELAALGTLFSRRTPQQYWSGAFSMPVDGPVRVTSVFATRRCYNCPDGSTPTTYHAGVDLAVSAGTPVHAPADGVVVFAGVLAERGNAIIIDHGMGVFSLFAHNTSFVAKVGQAVKKGDIVSLSGNTGLSNGPHLHWEVHVSGSPVDALEWVSRSFPW